MTSKVAIVSGASSGLGLAISRKLVHKNWFVFGLSKTKKHWAQARKQIPQQDSFCMVQCDVSRESTVKHFFSRLQQQTNHLDLLINNAGYVSKLERLEDTDTGEFNLNIQHNLLSVFLMCKYAIPFLGRKRKGLVINIASMAGKRAVPKLAGYSASKFGVLALSQCVAKENIDKGVSSVTICPGGMNTKMRERLFGKQDAQNQQSVDFVADVVIDIIENKLQVESGSDIVVRHGKIVAINAAPGV